MFTARTQARSQIRRANNEVQHTARCYRILCVYIFTPFLSITVFFFFKITSTAYKYGLMTMRLVWFGFFFLVSSKRRNGITKNKNESILYLQLESDRSTSVLLLACANFVAAKTFFFRRINAILTQHITWLNSARSIIKIIYLTRLFTRSQLTRSVRVSPINYISHGAGREFGPNECARARAGNNI